LNKTGVKREKKYTLILKGENLTSRHNSSEEEASPK